MVFESIVADVLNRFLGDYVQNFDSSKLKLGIWGGDVTLTHLDVKESALDELDLPVQVVSGHLGNLVLKIPWKNMYTAPVIATIKGLYVVVIPNLAVKYDAEKEEKAQQYAKQAELQRIEEAKLREAQKKDSKDDKDTFTEKLVTQIIKNLQVKISDIHIRYEDRISDPKNPFSFGLTLHNLSFQTTDEKWIPAIIHENVSIIHKLVTLDSLGFYWNSNTLLYSAMSPEERQTALEKCIASSTFRPPGVAYMLGPINSTAQLRLNTKPEIDEFKVPKVWLNVVMEEIAVGLSKRQYRDLMKMLESFDRMTIATLYRKYRPDVPHSGHAKEWWNFAIFAVLEGDVRRKRNNWSWERMKAHRKQCNLYKELYVSKLTGSKLSSENKTRLCTCEKELDLFNITVARKQAELEHLRRSKATDAKPKASWGSWVGSFFYASPSDKNKDDGSSEKNIVKQFEEAMTTEEKSKLYDAIGYQEQSTATVLPKEFVENKLMFLLRHLTLTLSDDTKSEPQVLRTILDDVAACVDQRPSAEALCVDAKIESFLVRGVPKAGGLIPVIVSSQEMAAKSLPLLSVIFETNPLDGSCDSRICLKGQSLEIFYDAITINELAEVFTPPEQIDFQQLQATALLKLEEFKEMSAFGLQYAIEQHKYFHVEIDMKPCLVTIPETGCYAEDKHLLVVSLGNFKMGSLKRDPESPTVRSMVKAGSTEDEVLSSMIEKAYDKYFIEVLNSQIVLAAPGNDWRKLFDSELYKENLLQPVSMRVDIHKSIISLDPRMPKLKISGVLPELHLNISDYQIYDVMKIVGSIPFPQSTPLPPEASKSKQVVTAVDTGNVNAKVMQKAKKEALETFRTSTSESEEGIDVSEPTQVQSTNLDVKFQINEFKITLINHVSSSKLRTLKFAFHRFGAEVVMRTFDLSANVYLGGILLENTGFSKPGSNDPIKLIFSPINELEDVFTLMYLQADKKGPEFATIYKSTLQRVMINMKALDFILHQEAILSCMEFSNKLLAKLESSTASVQPTVEQKKEVSKNRLEKKAGSKQKKDVKIIDMEILVDFDSINVMVCTVSYNLTEIKIKGLKAAVEMDKKKTTLTSSLSDLVVYNAADNVLYPKMMSTDAGEVFHLIVKMYNFGTDEENFTDLSAVDMSVSVSFGRMYIVFLNKFTSSLLCFLDHFQRAKDKVFEASMAAAEVAKHGVEQAYEKDYRILLDIHINAPIIFIPKNSRSRNTIVADLGTLKISNFFAFGNKRNELGIPAILDKMVLNLEELKLSRALVNPETNKAVAECILLEPVSFSVAIIRNLSASWFNEQPDIEIFGKLLSIKVSLSQEDYSTAMSILSENLSETADNVEIGPSASQMAIPRGSIVDREFPKLTQLSEVVEAAKFLKNSQAKVSTKFRLVFELDSACAAFYTGKTELSKTINVHNPLDAIGMVDVQSMNIEANMKSNNAVTASVILQDVILQDTRYSRTKGITRLMERTSKDLEERMMTIYYSQSEKGETNVDVKISSFTFVACLPYIMKLGEFFSQSDQEARNFSSVPPLTETVSPVQPLPAPTTEKKEASGTMTISLQVQKPDIALIEDMEDIDSNAIFFNNEISATLTMSDDVKVLSGKISNLTFYTALFNPVKRYATMVKILNPSELNLQCNMKPDSMHIDLLFKDLVLQISPGTVQLATNIMSTLTTEKVQVKKVVPPVADYTDLWAIRPLSECNFWFLETLSGKEKGMEASEDMLCGAPPSTVPNEQMLFTMSKVIVTVEAGVGSRTVPLILLESSFQAQISDWSSEISMESTLSTEISYYNEKLAVWEPLLEPIETAKGHRSWELFLEMSQKSNDNQIVEEESSDENLSQQPLKFEIRSDDVMELTVSKTCLDVLTNLSEAFGEAVKQNVVRDNKLPYAPFRVYNYLNVPITIILNSVFQILDATEEYATVILESGSPPLHLTSRNMTMDAKAKQSVLKKQFTKEDTALNIRIVAEDMSIERKISIARTGKSYFQLPRRTYPGDQWGFIVDVKSLYGSKVISFHSNILVHNHFTIPMDAYYMVSSVNEVKFCGTIEPNKDLHLPLNAVYTVTSELFFKPKDENKSYSLSLEPFVWKELIENPAANKTVQCKFKDSGGHSFYINVAGDVERVFFEDTSKKTVASTLYKINLYPTVRLRNLLVYPIHYSLQGVDKDFKLLEGETHELWSAEVGISELEIRLISYLDRDWACFKTLDKGMDELCAWTFCSSLVEKLITMELGMHTRQVCGSLIMELYSPYCMVNKTEMLLIYREDEGNCIFHPPNIDKPVLFSFRAKSFFSKKKASLKICDSEWSDKFSVDAVGNSGNVVAKSKDGKTYGVGVQIRLSPSGLTKIIIFTPFYILVNNCRFDIECREVSIRVNWIELKKDECVPFWPQDSSHSHEMVVRYFGEDYDSEKFSFKEAHSTLLKLKSKRGGIHVDCQVAQSSIILTFEDYIPGHASALLINYMADYSVCFNQSGGNSVFEVPPYSCVLYTWQDPMGKRLLSWKCGDKRDGHLDVVKDGVCEFKPENGVTSYWLSFLDGMQRVLVFTHDLISASAVRSAVQVVHMDQEFLVLLRGVCISLVHNDSRLEIMYLGITSTGIVWEGKKPGSTRFKALSLKDCVILENGYQRYINGLKVGNKQRGIYNLEGKLEVSFEDMKLFKPHVKKLKRTFQTGLWIEYKTSAVASHFHAKINRLQIDNQLADCVFPVVLAPVPPPKSVAAENAPKPFTELSIMLHQEEKSPIQQIKYCKILVQEFHIKLDQGFINSMILFFTPDEAAEVNYVKILAGDKTLTHSALKDVAAIYSSQEQKCYYDNLHFSPLKMHISFSMTGGSSKLENNKPTPIHSDFLNLLLQSVGVTLTEVQDVIFKLDYFERRYTFMSTQQLINEATSHYVGQAVKQLYMLVLGLDVIGNPVGLILGLGEGVSDLFYEPFQGAIQGPEEFLEGLGLGVKSLFGHAIGGAAGAASRITGTLGKGLAALTLDKDYQKKRRQNLNRRPQDVGQRFAQSSKGLVMGVFDGVTGVVTKPIEGAREEGVGGFFKGVGKGLIGVITRPTAGAVDFVSGSFDSVKRIAELQDEIKRLRPPRYIRTDGVIRPYVKRESEGSRLLQEVEKGKYSSTDVYEAHVPVGTDDKSFLLVTNNRVMYVTKGDVFGQWNTEWEYRWEELKGMPTATDDGIKILLKEPHKKKLSVFGSKIAGKLVHVQDPSLSHWIVTKMEEIMKSL